MKFLCFDGKSWLLSRTFSSFWRYELHMMRQCQISRKRRG
jgi:hypothetical protein